MTSERLPIREKIGYSLGDTASNIYFQTDPKTSTAIFRNCMVSKTLIRYHFNRMPVLFSAAKTSVIARSDRYTGWSMRWQINLWANMLDGNPTLKLISGRLSAAIQPDDNKRRGAYSKHFNKDINEVLLLTGLIPNKFDSGIF